MAWFSLFKALHTHRNDSTPLPSFPLSSSACLENKEMIHGRRRGSSGVQREGRGSGMGDLCRTADKQQEGGGKQTLILVLVLLHKLVCQPGSVYMQNTDSNRLVPNTSSNIATKLLKKTNDKMQTKNRIVDFRVWWTLTCRRVPVGLR